MSGNNGGNGGSNGNGARHRASLDILKKYGARWSVLTAMRQDLIKRGVSLPAEVASELDLAAIKIKSGCYSPCEVGCSLAKVEALLVPVACSVGEDHVNHWLTLLGNAMQDGFDRGSIGGLPPLQPVESKCPMFPCNC